MKNIKIDLILNGQKIHTYVADIYPKKGEYIKINETDSDYYIVNNVIFVANRNVIQVICSDVATIVTYLES